jgi:hypothetical protein
MRRHTIYIWHGQQAEVRTLGLTAARRQPQSLVPVHQRALPCPGQFGGNADHAAARPLECS